MFLFPYQQLGTSSQIGWDIPWAVWVTSKNISEFSNLCSAQSQTQPHSSHGRKRNSTQPKPAQPQKQLQQVPSTTNLVLTVPGFTRKDLFHEKSHFQVVKTGVFHLNEQKHNNSSAWQTGKKNNVGVCVFCFRVLKTTIILDVQLRGLQTCPRSSFINNDISECALIWIQHCLKGKIPQSRQGTAQQLLLLNDFFVFSFSSSSYPPRSQTNHIIKKMGVKMTGGKSCLRDREKGTDHYQV